MFLLWAGGRAGECVCISEENKGKPVLFFLPSHEIPLLLGRRRRPNRPNGAEFVKEESLMPPPEKKGRFFVAFVVFGISHMLLPFATRSSSPPPPSIGIFRDPFLFHLFSSSDLSSTMLLWRSRSERERDAYKRNAHNKHVRTYYTHINGRESFMYCTVSKGWRNSIFTTIFF